MTTFKPAQRNLEKNEPDVVFFNYQLVKSAFGGSDCYIAVSSQLHTVFIVINHFKDKFHFLLFLEET